jgi:hypothetical protein
VPLYYILQIDGPENVDVTGNSNLICNPIMQDAAGRSVLCILWPASLPGLFLVSKRYRLPFYP